MIVPRNVIHILRKEFLERIRSKAFIIVTILAPLMLSAVFILPVYLATRSGGTTRVALAASGPGAMQLAERVRQRLERRDSPQPAQTEALEKAAERAQRGARQPGPSRFVVTELAEATGNEAATRERLRKDLLAGRVQGYLWLEDQAGADPKTEYYARSVSDFAAIRGLEVAVSTAATRMRLAARGIQQEEMEALLRSTSIRTVRVSETGDREDRGFATFLASFAFMIVLYTTLIFYGVAIMRSVIEEKNSRIYEVLLSCVKPVELMAGKIVGVAAVGLTQYLAWTVIAVLAGGGFGIASMRSVMAEVNFPGHLLFFFVLFFLLGYLLYSSMFAALGATVNNEQEAQQLQILILQFLIVPMLVAQLVIRSPNSTASVVLSLIPFFAPMLMFLRLTVQTPPVWQVVLSIVLLGLTIVGMVWVAARIYRVGILMYGKRPTLPELWRWLKAA